MQAHACTPTPPFHHACLNLAADMYATTADMAVDSQLQPLGQPLLLQSPDDVLGRFFTALNGDKEAQKALRLCSMRVYECLTILQQVLSMVITMDPAQAEQRLLAFGRTGGLLVRLAVHEGGSSCGCSTWLLVRRLLESPHPPAARQPLPEPGGAGSAGGCMAGAVWACGLVLVHKLPGH